MDTRSIGEPGTVLILFGNRDYCYSGNYQQRADDLPPAYLLPEKEGRRLIITRFQEKELINERFARNLLSRKNSGFSVDNTVGVYGNDNKAREALSQYIAKPPVSLEKLKYEPFHGKVLYKTPKYNEYFGPISSSLMPWIS